MRDVREGQMMRKKMEFGERMRKVSYMHLGETICKRIDKGDVVPVWAAGDEGDDGGNW